MIRLAVVLFVIVFGFVLPPADFKLPGIPGRVYFKNLRIQNQIPLVAGSRWTEAAADRTRTVRSASPAADRAARTRSR
jgi:hypothetical protein